MELKRERMVDTTEVLLFDILQEMKKMNATFEYLSRTTVTGDALPEVGKFEGTLYNGLLPMPKDGMRHCRYCGGWHEKTQQIAACAKKHKGGSKT
jgi:hypothetical protein